jgi:DNA mismatch repair protein MutS2
VGRDFHILVITGPNTGGKTVALKTMGLLVCMAQAGLHVPAAEGATMTVFAGVYADIGDEQSIEQSLSTFSGHLTNIIAILEHADDRALVLLDELGAGTDPVEGAALARAILEYLRVRGITTVASTHYSDLKMYAHGAPGVTNASAEFDVETLRPTYELTIGLPGRSNALAIARRLGLPATIVDAAREGVGTAGLDMEGLLAEIRAARRQAQADRAAAGEARRNAESWAGKLEQGVKDLEAERARVLNEARDQAESELALARAAMARLLRQAESAAATRAAIVEAAAGLDEVAAALDVREPGAGAVVRMAPADLLPGRQVRVLSFNQVGEVVALKGDDVEVQLGRLRLTVPLRDLEPVAVPASSEPAVEPAGVRLRRAATATSDLSIELHLRGLRVEDALEKLDAYLDAAVLSGLPWVRIVHGHGTGVMKAAVRDTLRRHPQVKRYRPGERGEGGDGATVVYFD